jgi:hypothetical protein
MVCMVGCCGIACEIGGIWSFSSLSAAAAESEGSISVMLWVVNEDVEGGS